MFGVLLPKIFYLTNIFLRADVPFPIQGMTYYRLKPFVFIRETVIISIKITVFTRLSGQEI